MKNKKNHLYFCFADFACKIIGEQKKISYIKKCYLKSPFAKFIKKSSKKGIPLATLEILPIKKKIDVDFFRLQSHSQKLFFKLECSENQYKYS